MTTAQTKHSEVQVLDLGHKPYKDVWNFQKEMQMKRMKGDIEDVLILVEHDPVYTLGKNANPDHLLQSRDRSIDVFTIERGGDITCLLYTSDAADEE